MVGGGGHVPCWQCISFCNVVPVYIVHFFSLSSIGGAEVSDHFFAVCINFIIWMAHGVSFPPCRITHFNLGVLFVSLLGISQGLGSRWATMLVCL